MKNPLYWCLGFGVLLATTGCDRDGRGTVNAINTERPVQSASLVEAEHPKRRDVSAYLEETGHVTAENQVEVLAKGTGHCVSVLVEEGDTVEKGQVLAELDKDEMEAQVRQSRVNASQQEAAYERADRGYEQGIISKAERDNALYSYEQAKATLEMQEVQLSFLTIRAPIDGVVTKRLLQEGMLVSSGMPLFNIVDPSSYILPIQVTERSLPRLRVGQQARVRIDSSGARDFLATVRRINPGVDPQSGTVKVILDFAPGDYPYLRESAFARYSLVMDTHEDALVVPKDAIIEENAQRYVMVVEPAGAPGPDSAEAGPAGGANGAEAAAAGGETRWIASRVEVETGLEDSDYTEILAGIDDESLVITLGQQTVDSGDLVRVGNMEAVLEARDALSADELLERAREDRPEPDQAAGTQGGDPALAG